MPRKVHDGLKKRCGCARRAWAKCAHPWHFSFFYNDTEHRYSLDVLAKARGVKPPRSKTDAETLRDALRVEIRNGTFVDPSAPPPPEPAADTRLTFGDVVKQYRDRYVNVPTRRPSAAAMFDIHLKMLERVAVPAAHGTTVALKDKAIDAITKADIEAIRTVRRAELAAAQAVRLARLEGATLENADASRREIGRAHV